MKTCAWMTMLAGAALAAPVLAADHPEVEPNDSKAAANAFTLPVGDSVSGLTTGALATAGFASMDNFRIKTAAAPLGVYRYTMTLTSPVVGHTVSLRGLTQAGGVITAGSDATLQAGITQADTTRLAAWYGFGRQEEVYYRVTGTANTTAGYTATLGRATVTPTVLATVLPVGQYTIRGTLTGSTGDTDLWVYNRDTMQPLAGFGNDDTPTGTVGGGSNAGFATLTRTFAAGRYLMAIADWNLANNLPSPPDDFYRAGNVMDFPDVLANADNEAAWTATVVFNTGPDINGADAATISLPPSSVPFEVRFLAFDVASPCAADVGVQGGTAGQDGLLNNNDFIVFIAWFFAADPRADVGRQGGIAPGDGLFNNNDFVVYINLFFAGC